MPYYYLKGFRLKSGLSFIQKFEALIVFLKVEQDYHLKKIIPNPAQLINYRVIKRIEKSN